jgi:hypothetical protein
MKTQIQIPSKTKYLSEAMTSLPSNCLFDKGKVGCGGTTIALEIDPSDYVICVPFVSLIDNKMNQVDSHGVLRHSNLFGVYEGIGPRAIKNYLKTDGPKKVMVTYDSLERLMNYIDPSKFKILIDELHLLFNQYSFRREAVQKVLPNYSKFKEYCFMTATMLEEEFILDELEKLPIVEAVWENVKTVKVRSVGCQKDVKATVIEYCKAHLSGIAQGNAYFFVNSVEFIKEIVSYLGLDESNTRVIYSKGNKTQIGLPNSSTTSNPKKLNFLTSTAFEGSDIYDTEGKTYIISDSRRPHTLTDISTSFQQIAGRIRDTKYGGEITHIFTQTRYNSLSYEEFKEASERQIKIAAQMVEELNNVSEVVRKTIAVAVESYVTKTDDLFSFDKNLVKIDRSNFKIVRCMYSLRVNLEKELEDKGYEVEQKTSCLNIKPESKKAVGFKEVASYIMANPSATSYLLEAIKKYPFLEEAISKLGFEGIRDEGFIVTNIKRKLTTLLNISQEAKVAKLLKVSGELESGMFVTSRRARDLVQQSYSKIGVGKVPNIKDYYEVKEGVKRMGKRNEPVKGYTIIMPKIVLGV